MNNPIVQEKLLKETGLKYAREQMRACKELGPQECVIDRTAGDTKDTASSGELVEGESKRISFSQEVFKGNGNELMGKKPTKIDEQKLTKTGKYSKRTLFRKM